MTNQMFNPQPCYSGVTIQIANPTVNAGYPNYMNNGYTTTVNPGYIASSAYPQQCLSNYDCRYINGIGSGDVQRPSQIQNIEGINHSNSGYQELGELNGLTNPIDKNYPQAYPAQYYINNYGEKVGVNGANGVNGTNGAKNGNGVGRNDRISNQEIGHGINQNRETNNRNEINSSQNNSEFANIESRENYFHNNGQNINKGYSNSEFSQLNNNKTASTNNTSDNDFSEDNNFRKNSENLQGVNRNNSYQNNNSVKNSDNNSDAYVDDKSPNNSQYDENGRNIGHMNNYKIYADKNEPKPESDMKASQTIISDLDEREAQIQEEKKNTKETKIVALTDEYIKSLENYLNNPNDEIRLMASKEILTRLDEDHDRYDDAALNALLNKMLQDPNKLVRIASLSAFASQLASGNDYTVQLLHNIQANPNADKEDVLQAADILLKMSAGVEVKNIPNPSVKNQEQQK